MKREQVRQMYKNEALNKIIKMYGPGGFSTDPYDEESYGEQRDTEIRWIVENLIDTLKEI